MQQRFKGSINSFLPTDLADLRMLLMARPRVTLSLRKEMPRMAMARGKLSRLWSGDWSPSTP